MAEPSLSLTVVELRAATGQYLGYGRGPEFGEPAWTAQQTSVIDELVQSGYRRFVQPPPLPGERGSYDWSFMKPTASLSLASGGSTIDLPDDFGGFEGPVTVLATSSTSQPWRIEWRNEAQVRAMYATAPSTTGPPVYCAELPLKGMSANRGQKFQLYVYPLADQAYTLQVQIYVNPNKATTSLPYLYGGAEHAETLKASVIAAAELYLDDAPGPRNAYFMERLAASVSADRRKKPQKLGRNLDRSDWDGYDQRWRHWGMAPATYNGSSFE